MRNQHFTKYENIFATLTSPYPMEAFGGNICASQTQHKDQEWQNRNDLTKNRFFQTVIHLCFWLLHSTVLALLLWLPNAVV